MVYDVLDDDVYLYLIDYYNFYFIFFYLIKYKTISLSIFDFFFRTIELNFIFHTLMSNGEIDFFVIRIFVNLLSSFQVYIQLNENAYFCNLLKHYQLYNLVQEGGGSCENYLRYKKSTLTILSTNKSK